MSKYLLKDSIKQYIGSFQLDEQQTDALIQLQRTTHSKINDDVSLHTKKLFKLKIAGIVGGILSLVIMGVLYTSLKPSISQNIASEVSYNHMKLMPLETTSTQITDLNKYFTKLDFKLTNTQILKDSDWEMLGARYCSIQSHAAAQLRLRHKQTGIVETLYQAPYSKQFKDLPILEKNQAPIEENSKGMGVKIWIENGVLFALTNNKLKN